MTYVVQVVSVVFGNNPSAVHTGCSPPPLPSPLPLPLPSPLPLPLPSPLPLPLPSPLPFPLPLPPAGLVIPVQSRSCQSEYEARGGSDVTINNELSSLTSSVSTQIPVTEPVVPSTVALQ